MKIEFKFQQGLKKLIKEQPLDGINVISLCKFVKSNRQTFYYHYRDISDVVDSILLEDNLGYGKKLFDFESVLKTVLAYINTNFQFIYAINNSYANEKLHNYLFTYFYKRVYEILKANKEHDIKIITRYVSNLATDELVFWINTKRKETQITLSKRLNVLWNYYTKQYYIDIKKAKD